MPRNRNKYRRQSLTEVRVNGQDIRISPYLAQYTAKGKGEAEHVRQMTELVCVTRPVPEIADQFIAALVLNEGSGFVEGNFSLIAAATGSRLP